jgi:hypothetical protein
MPLLVFLLGSALPVWGQAEDEAAKRVPAGPFSVLVPAAWADGVIVEKIPILPIYTKRSWQEYQAREEKRKISPREPSLDIKPGYSNRPEHWAIRFPKLVLPGQGYDPANAGDDATAPQILIHKTADWAGVFGDGSFDAAAVRKTMKNLRAMVENRDPMKNPVFVDAELAFIVGKTKLRFSGGHGFRVLTQWDWEADFVRKGRLHYLFLGLSDDGSCQIVATFPIDLPGLPDDSTREHLGFSRPLPYQFPKYERVAKKWLTANASKATPSLAELDAMISSLDARQWP